MEQDSRSDDGRVLAVPQGRERRVVVDEDRGGGEEAFDEPETVIMVVVVFLLSSLLSDGDLGAVFSFVLFVRRGPNQSLCSRTRVLFSLETDSQSTSTVN